MASRTATSIRGLNAPPENTLVNPLSSTISAFCAVLNAWSSGGSSDTSSSETKSVYEMWPCPSIKPGISVPPPPSITSAPSRAMRALPFATLSMRLPWTSTSPANGAEPVPSKILTWVNSVLAISVSDPVDGRRESCAPAPRRVKCRSPCSGPRLTPFGLVPDRQTRLRDHAAHGAAPRFARIVRARDATSSASPTRPTARSITA